MVLPAQRYNSFMRITVLLPGFLISLIAVSQVIPKNHDEDKCCCSTYDAGQCLIRVNHDVDAELNDTYQKALRRWNQPENAKKLREAERAWINYRDANCDAELATYDHGSMGSNMSAFCQIRLTRERIAEIKAIYLEAH